MSAQPIKTAPKDGTWVLVFGDTRDGQRWAAGQYRRLTYYGFKRPRGDWITAWATSKTCGITHVLRIRKPTHWMPLPQPPES